MAGFSVDLTALSRATNAILDTMDQMAAARVRDLDPPTDAVGHEDFADALRQFCHRWDIGVENLETDVAAVTEELVRCLRAYSATDEAAAADFGGIIGRSTGPDPGVL